MALMEGIFPSELKLAKVVPVSKSGESDKVHNYRSISVISYFFFKYLKKIMYNNVVNFIDKNETFLHIGLGSGRAVTQHAIITLVDKIISSMDSGDLIIGVFLDLKKNI